MKVVVTGVTSDFATAILPSLFSDSEIESIVGIDIREPRLEDAKLTYVNEDVRSPDLAEAFKGADVVVHLAFVVEEIKNKELTFDVNLNGSKNVIVAADAAGVKRLVISSSSSAYGSHKDYPAPVTEEEFPRGNFNKYYYNNKAEVEHYVQWWSEENPKSKLAITLLRPPTAVGPDIKNSMVEMFAAPVATFPTDTRPFQLLHQGDLASAFHAAIKGEASGPFNLGTDDALEPKELARIHGQKLIQGPLRLFEVAADIGFRLKLFPASSQWVTLGDPVISNQRARKELGWQPQFTSAESACIHLLQSGRPILDSEAMESLKRKEVAEAALEAATRSVKQWATGVPSIAAALDGPEDIDRFIDRLEHVYIPYKGQAVHLEVHAADPTAPTIVFSPGLGAHARFYLPALGKLCDEGFNVVAIDRPGHGLSQGRRGGASFTAILDTVEEAIRYARERFEGPVVLAGSSLGGIITWFALTREPDIDAAICHNIAHPEIFHEPAMKLKVPLLKALAQLAPHAPIPIKQLADWDAASDEPLLQQAFKNETDGLWAWSVCSKAVAGLFNYQPPREWNEVEIPTLVLVGGSDQMVTKEFTDRVLEVARPKNLELKVLDGMVHSIFHDHLNEVLPVFTDYVKKTVAEKTTV